MNILLINDNPVVTKLVTLSAQKTGDELEVVNAIEQIDAGAYDLLIFDNALFDPLLYEQLTGEVTFAKKLYMGSRGVDKPDDFDMMVNKPFLPTDLVDLFTDISHELEKTASVEEEPIFDETLLNDEEIDLEILDDEVEVDLEDTMESLDEEEIDLDSAIEALSDTSELDLEDELLIDDVSDLEDELHSDDVSDLEVPLDASDEVLDELAEPSELQESILDKDDLEEVQALLEEEEPTDTAVSDTPALDNDEERLSEVDISEEIEDEVKAEEPLEDTIDEDLSDDAPEEEMDISEVTMETAIDEEVLEDVSSDEDLTLIEESLEDAVENLSEEELNAPVNEEMLLDIVNDESSAFDEFDALDINAVRSALGETSEEVIEDQCDRDALEQVEEQLLSSEHEAQTQEEQPTSDPKNGIEALQAVLSALQNKEVAQSLKAMNITINISFGEQ